MWKQLGYSPSENRHGFGGNDGPAAPLWAPVMKCWTRHTLMKSLRAPQKVVPRGKPVFCFRQFLSAHLLGMRSILRGTHLSFPLLPCLQRPVFSLTVNFSPCLKNQANLSPSRPRYSAGKESACNAGDPGLIPGSGRCSGEGNSSPLQYFWASPVAQQWRIRLQCRRPGFDPWVGKMPWRRERLPTPVFWPRGFHGLYIQSMG